MKLSLPALVLPLACGGFAAWAVSLGSWETLRVALIPAISLIAAAVLVRLARGFPFTNPDHFTLAQFRDVAAKLKANARKLRALIFVCLGSLVAMIGFPPVYRRLPPAPIDQAWIASGTEATLSFAIAALTAYAFVRLVEVVQSDVSLLDLQAKILEGVIAAKNAQSFEEELKAHPPAAIVGASSFGKPLQ